MIDTFFFDWDGTLIDSAQPAFEALRKALDALGVPLEMGTYERIYSPNWYAMFEVLQVPRERWDEADKLWMRHYDYDASQLAAGGREALAELEGRGYAIGIVSSGNRARILREVDAFGLAGIFHVVVCGEDVANKKPHPEGLEIAMERLQKRPDQCCYVGDCPEDIEMGRRAGVQTIGILSRYPSSRNLADARPDLLCGSLHELILKV